MMRSTLGRSVPAICISKPDGYGCHLYKYNCDGTWAGRIDSDAETADACRAAAEALEECKVYMVFFDQKNNQAVNESFDNCSGPPPSILYFSLELSELISDDQTYTTWGMRVNGAGFVFMDGFFTGEWVATGLTVHYRFDKAGDFWTTRYAEHMTADPMSVDGIHDGWLELGP